MNEDDNALEPAIDYLLECIARSREQGWWGSNDIFASTKWVTEQRKSLNPRILDTLVLLLRDHLENVDVEGTSLSWPREKILSSLRAYQRSGVIGTRLAQLLIRKRRVSSMPDFETVIEVGALIEQFEEYDPYLQVVGPGVLARYAVWGKSTERFDPEYSVCTVVEDIRRTLGLCRAGA